MLENTNKSIIINCFDTQNNVCWRLTTKCNRECDFCLSDSSPKRILGKIDYVVILHRLKNLGVTKITYAGGEPFIHPQLESIALLGKELGFNQVVTTNGDFLFRKMPTWLSAFSFLRLSFYGDESTHDKIMGKGHFSKSLNLARTIFNDYGLKVAANLMLTSSNHRNLIPILEKLKVHGVQQVILLSYIRTGNAGIDDKYLIKVEGDTPRLNLLELTKEVRFLYGVKYINFDQGDFYIVIDEKGNVTLPSGGERSVLIAGHITDDELIHPVDGKVSSKIFFENVWNNRDKIRAVKECI